MTDVAAAAPAVDPAAAAAAEDPNKMPEGIQPLFLSTPTCEIFNLRPGTDISAENPLKKLKKADIMADIMARRAISDFQPYKEPINAYPGDELLIVLDFEWKYGQNFYLCMTTESAERILNPPKPKDAPQEAEAEPGLPGSRTKKGRQPWVSLGSEKEVDEERALPTRNLITVMVSRRRGDFGRPCQWEDRAADDLYLEFKPYRDPNFDLHRMELNMGVQAVPFTKNEYAQYSKFQPKNAAIQYEPLSMDKDMREDIQSSEGFRTFLNSSIPLFDEALKQNLLFDIFTNRYSRLGDEELGIDQGNQIVLQEYQSFTDLKNSKDRAITCIEWHPSFKGIVAMSCVQRLTVEERVENGFNIRSRQSLVIFWSVSDPIHPQLLLDAPDDIVSFKFNPTNPNLIIGGCVNGQVLLWDITDYQDILKYNNKTKSSGSSQDTIVNQEKATDAPFVQYIASSAIELGHKAIVTDLTWLPPQVDVNYQGDIQNAVDTSMANQFVTSSLDGYIAFWDLRFKKDFKSLDLVWKPFFRIPLSNTDGSYDYGITKISLDIHHTEEAANEPTGDQEKSDEPVQNSGLTSKFFCGSEEGDLLYADWFMEKKDKEDKGSRIEAAFPCHVGAVSEIHRSPFLNDLLLSVGGNGFQIWKEKVNSGPLVTSGYANTTLTVGRWSPTRPGVFFIGRQDGAVEIWDLLDRSHVPIATHSVSSNPVASLSISSGLRTRTQSQFLAAGDDLGTLYVFEVSKALRRPQKNEQSVLRAFFDREVKRLGYVMSRKALRTKDKKEKEAPKEGEAAAVEKKETGKAEENEEMFEKLYQQMEKTFLDNYSAGK